MGYMARSQATFQELSIFPVSENFMLAGMSLSTPQPAKGWERELLQTEFGVPPS